MKQFCIEQTLFIFTCSEVEHFCVFLRSIKTILIVCSLSCCASPKVGMSWKYYITFCCNYEVACLPRLKFWGKSVLRK